MLQAVKCVHLPHQPQNQYVEFESEILTPCHDIWYNAIVETCYPKTFYQTAIEEHNHYPLLICNMTPMKR